jgi:hypothetical protein
MGRRRMRSRFAMANPVKDRATQPLRDIAGKANYKGYGAFVRR